MNPFKKGQKISKNIDRIEMLKLAIDPEDEISEFETNREQLSYTIDTVKYFKSKYKNAKIYLLIGSDLLSRIHKWKDIDQISKLTQILVAKRTEKINKINIKKFKMELLDNRIFEFSSTQVRLGDYSNVPEPVMKYISKNLMYLDDMVRRTLPIALSKHCFATADLAGKYAKLNNTKWNRAFYTGLLHDLAKKWTNEQYDEIFSKYLPNKKLQDHQKHQWAAALWFKHIYKSDDEEIFQALANHTTLELKPISTLDKIVFMADKLCEGRKWEGIQEVRKAAYKNLDIGFKEILKINLKFL